MNTPEWLKPALIGAVAGAIAVTIGGFSVAGWVGQKTAVQMANAQADEEVTTALASICVEQAKQDPDFTATMMRLKEGRSYERPNMMMETTSWATMPGSKEPSRRVATACMETLEGMS